MSDYLISLGFILLFVPYLSALRSLLGTAEAHPPVLSRIALIGGLFATVLGATAGVFWGGLAIGIADNPNVDDGVIEALMDLDTYAFATPLQLSFALFILAASIVVWQTGVLWRWLGLLGVLAAALHIAGAAWPIDGDHEVALAIIGIFGSLGGILWVLLSSINMLVLRHAPETTANQQPSLGSP